MSLFDIVPVVVGGVSGLMRFVRFSLCVAVSQGISSDARTAVIAAVTESGVYQDASMLLLRSWDQNSADRLFAFKTAKQRAVVDAYNAEVAVERAKTVTLVSVLQAPGCAPVVSRDGVVVDIYSGAP